MFATVLPLLLASYLQSDGNEAVRISQLHPAAQKLVREQKDSDALPLYLELVKGNPTDPQSWTELGDLYDRMKRYPEAIDAYKRAKEIGFTYPWVFSTKIAKMYAKSGDKEQAISWISTSASEGDRNLLRKKTDADFKQLLGDPRFDELVANVDASKMTRDEGWRYDIRLASREYKRMHFSPFHTTPEKDYDAFVAKLSADVAMLSDNEIRVGIAKIAAMVNDGHSHIGVATSEAAVIPVQFIYFEDGLRIAGVTDANKDLMGAKVIEIEGQPAAQVFDKVTTLLGRENPLWPKFLGCRWIRQAWVLNGLGIIPDTKSVSMKVEVDGKEQTITLPFAPPVKTADWRLLRNVAADPALTFQNRDKSYWDKFLPESKTYYVQYNAVQNDTKGVSLEKFWNNAFDFIEKNDVDRLVLDMRWNGGGNNFLNAPLIERLIKSKINVDKKLYVITSRNTFSAAVCGVAQIERYTKAIFVGEPIGSSPNLIGESIPVVLPYSKMEGSVSDLFWQNSFAMDHRTWIPVSLYIPWRYEDFKAGKDPAFDAILADK